MAYFFQQIVNEIFGKREGFTHDLKSGASNQDGYFDIVIGNPPYLKEGRVFKIIFEGLKHSPYYQGKMDLWYMFACVGIDLLAENGTLCFIATNNWVTNDGASKLRNKIMIDSKMVQIIDFNDLMIFESASIQTMIMLFSRNSNTDNYTFDYRRLQKTKTNKMDAVLLLSRDAKDAIYLSPIINRNLLKDSKLTFSDNITSDILNKIQTKQNFYLNGKTDRQNGIFSEIGSGIDVLQDVLNKKAVEQLDYKAQIGDGVFVLTHLEYETIQFSEIEKNILKPYYTTEQLNRYWGEKNNQRWLIYTKSDANRYIDRYPNVKRHLEKYSKIITSDFAPYGLHRTREQRFFEGEKILVLRKCSSIPSFTYTDFSCYVSRAFMIIKTNRINQKYLTGILNSKLITFWLKNKGKMQGNNYQVDKEPLLHIPIRVGNETQINSIISFVEQIISLKQVNPNEDTCNIEKEIDRIVYNIYELTENEVVIIGKNS